MHFTRVLQFYVRYRRVPGLLRYGKERVIPPISVKAKRKAAKLLVIERDNVDLLNKPFLSEAEQAAYNSVYPPEPYINDEARKKLEFQARLEALRPNYKTEDLLMHLNVNKKWE